MTSVSTSLSLKDYLKKYTDSDQAKKDKTKKKKKKKEEREKKTGPSGVLVVDEDPIWHRQVGEEDDEREDGDCPDEKPQVDEDIEVKRMKRLEEIRAKKPYLSVSSDGSGWVSVSDSKPNSKTLSSSVREESPDLSPARHPPHLPSSTNQRHDSPDLSPPRQNDRNFSPPKLPSHSRKDESSSLSPPRQNYRNYSIRKLPFSSNRRHNLPDLLPPRQRYRNSPPPQLPSSSNRRHDSPDLSPPRQRYRNSPSTQLPSSSKRHNSPELLPPRKRHRDSPPPKLPPSSNRRRHDSSSLSLPRRRHDSTDFSPPRQRGGNSPSPKLPSSETIRHDSPDLSRPRRRGRNSPQFPSSRTIRHDSPDLSPPHKKCRDSQSQLHGGRDGGWGEVRDLSPSRRGGSKEIDLSPPRKKAKDPKGAEAGRSGLFIAGEIKKEIEKKKREESLRFSQMDPSVSGRGAEPVYRDKEGKKVSMEEYIKLKQGKPKPEEKKLEWGKGLAQKREAEAREQELELEKNKPFARSRDDPELDKMLKERIHWGDPMAHLVKRKLSEPVLEDLGNNEEMKESGFIIPQTIPSHSWLKRGIHPPGNRYGIRPGRHWDGVDRSNGFEKEMFKKQNEKRAKEQEAYLWSVSDM
ncbi:BUD13 homolog [Amborella trichopoda]|uniref:BUD13 homolog n=1 Tax=Amborella trichopoda TaxID=13333 RepID=W1NU98_AMBTC|nr:BUD13 homolog [Amborella trichopoda]ERN01182.1 hypothetical protein AMTR_s00002p00228700 [Amborella trichopoda]|eukprot:XP_006838613.1 BUD13 homolog [Amborella trichopoda]